MVLVAIASALLGGYVVAWRGGRAQGVVDQRGTQQSLQGTWVVISGEMDGRDVPVVDGPVRWLIEGDTIRIVRPDGAGDEAKFVVDASNSSIDLASPKDSPYRGRVVPGVYRLDGDRLAICLDNSCKRRPPKLEARSGTKDYLTTLRRE